MNNIKIFYALLLAASLSGCNGLPKPSNSDDYFTVFSGFPLPAFFMASATQWNEDYAVTVSHTPFLPYEKFSCSTKCDLIFFKHKADGKIPLWRESQAWEEIVAKGASPYLTGAKGEGRVYPAPFLNTNEKSGVLYGIHDAPIVKGMSGGPVVAADGKVVGINMGIYSTSLNGEWKKHPGLAGAKRISIFVPYATILREWKLLQEKLAKQ